MHTQKVAIVNQKLLAYVDSTITGQEKHMEVLMGLSLALVAGLLPMLAYALILWWFDRYEYWLSLPNKSSRIAPSVGLR